MNTDIQEIKDGIAKFEAFKKELERQQLVFPLDKKSIDVVHDNVVVPTGNVVIPVGLVAFNEAIEITTLGKKYLLETTKPQ